MAVRDYSTGSSKARANSSNGTPRKQRRMTPKRDRNSGRKDGKKNRNSISRGKRSISFDTSTGSVQGDHEQLETENHNISDLSMHDSNGVSNSRRGRRRVVPSYVESDPESAEEFQDPVPTVWGLQGNDPVQSVTPPRKSSRKKEKSRNLFEIGSDDDSLQISDFDDDNDEGMPSSHLRLNSKQYGDALSGSRNTPSVSAQKRDRAPAINLEEADILEDDFETPTVTQNSRTTRSVLDSGDNPFVGIVAQVGEGAKSQANSEPELSDDWSEESSEDQFEDMLPTRDQIAALEKPIASHDSLMSSVMDVDRLSCSPVDAEESRGTSSFYASNFKKRFNNASARSVQKPKVPDHMLEQLFEDHSDLDELEFGAFRTVVDDVIRSTDRLSQTQELAASDSETSMNAF